MPYQPGTTSRSGAPCCGGSGAPFISSTSSTSSASASASAEPADVVLLDASFDAVVGTGEAHVDGSGRGPGLVQHAGQRSPRPLRGADRLAEPRLADRPGMQPGAAVAGAFHRDPDRPPRKGAQRVEVQGQFTVDVSADPQAPDRRIDQRDVVVHQQVVQSGGVTSYRSASNGRP